MCRQRPNTNESRSPSLWTFFPVGLWKTQSNSTSPLVSCKIWFTLVITFSPRTFYVFVVGSRIFVFSSNASNWKYVLNLKNKINEYCVLFLLKIMYSYFYWRFVTAACGKRGVAHFVLDDFCPPKNSTDCQTIKTAKLILQSRSYFSRTDFVVSPVDRTRRCGIFKMYL